MEHAPEQNLGRDRARGAALVHSWFVTVHGYEAPPTPRP